RRHVRAGDRPPARESQRRSSRRLRPSWLLPLRLPRYPLPARGHLALPLRCTTPARQPLPAPRDPHPRLRRNSGANDPVQASPAARVVTSAGASLTPVAEARPLLPPEAAG